MAVILQLALSNLFFLLSYGSMDKEWENYVAEQLLIQALPDVQKLAIIQIYGIFWQRKQKTLKRIYTISTR